MNGLDPLDDSGGSGKTKEKRMEEKRIAATPEKIQQLRELCDKYGLEGRGVLEKYTNGELSEKIYNGAGPDSWLPGARDLLTKLMSLFEPVVLIHDVQFSESDARRETFDRTAAMWKENCGKIFDAEYPFWTWRQLRPAYRAARARWLAVMSAANAAVSGSMAFKAWCAAHSARGDGDA